MHATLQANVQPVSMVEPHPSAEGALLPSSIVAEAQNHTWSQVCVSHRSPGARCIGQA